MATEKHYYKYTFGMNNEAGQLIEISVPATSLHEAVSTVKRLLFSHKCTDNPIWDFWLNDLTDY